MSTANYTPASYVWVHDPHWRVPSCWDRCRFPRCKHDPVADLCRHDYRGRVKWYSYCSAHMYGRVLMTTPDGERRVMVAVAPGSQAALRGEAL